MPSQKKKKKNQVKIPDHSRSHARKKHRDWTVKTTTVSQKFSDRYPCPWKSKINERTINGLPNTVRAPTNKTDIDWRRQSLKRFFFFFFVSNPLKDLVKKYQELFSQFTADSRLRNINPIKFPISLQWQNLRQLIDITEHSYIFTKPYPEKSEEEEITRIAKEIIVTVTFHPRREPLFKVPRHMDEHREKAGPIRDSQTRLLQRLERSPSP